jgi:pimeloyl-ACP methyl ester carboxylesterase
MAAVTPPAGKQSTRRPIGQSGREHHRSPSSPEIVNPAWLLKAAAIVIAAALFCGYLTYCLLFYQGQWQLVLHPDRSRPAPNSIAGSAYETVHFGVDESGVPQLTGWWIPAQPTGRYAAETILYFPSGDGSLVDALPRLVALHSLGINVFAFNYRGYGQSAKIHPNELRMTEDSLSAWRYLTISRQISVVRIIPTGEGVGAALAVKLAEANPKIPGVILQSPLPGLLKVVIDDPRTRLLPVRALFHENFEIASTLTNLRMPKLFIIPAGSSSLSLAKGTPASKVIVATPLSNDDVSSYLEQVASFINQLGFADP